MKIPFNQETIPDELESIKEEVCDNICRHVIRTDIDEVELADICANCPMNRL